MKKANLGYSILVVGALLAMPAQADDQTAPPAPTVPANGWQRQGKGGHHGEMKEVFAACSKSTGVAAPEPGSKPNWSAGDKTALHACVQRFHDDMKSCLSAAGIDLPVPGEHRKPSSEERSAFKACHQKALLLISSS